MEGEARRELRICRDPGVKRPPGGVENGAEAAELVGNDDDRRDDENVDHRVLDERDHRRRAQAALVSEERQYHERDGDRRVRHDPLAGEAQRKDDFLQADKLQRDVGHRRQDPGQRDRELQSLVPVAAEDKIAGGHVSMFFRHRPQPRQRQIQEWIDDNGVRDREEPIGANGEDHCGNRDDRVGGVKIAAEQEPGDPAAEASAAKTPFGDVIEIGRLPARRNEAEHRHQPKKEYEHGRRNDVEMVEHR